MAKKNFTLGIYILILMAILYNTIFFLNSVLTNRYVGSDHLFILGGTLTSPLVFIISDIIAEIYGYRVARSVLYFSLICQGLFLIISNCIIQSPHPEFFNKNEYYDFILGRELQKIYSSNIFAYLIAILVNVKIIAKWKILLSGRKFWMRYLGSSFFSMEMMKFFHLKNFILKKI